MPRGGIGPSGPGPGFGGGAPRMVQRLRSGLALPRARCARPCARCRAISSSTARWPRRPTKTPACRSGSGRPSPSPRWWRACSACCTRAAGPATSGTLGRVLEIGTGCGYQTALLGQMAQRVISIERLKPLHDKARANLGEQRAGHIRLVYGDGRLGHPPNAPYDSIIAAAGGNELPAAWLDQLADGGRLVAPLEGRRQRPGAAGGRSAWRRVAAARCTKPCTSFP